LSLCLYAEESVRDMLDEGRWQPLARAARVLVAVNLLTTAA
jgi:hypothetical protein